MPLVRIEVLEGRSPQERVALMDAVHDALVEAFQIPDEDRTQRLIELDRDHFDIPPGTADDYTLIEITAFPGRSSEAKSALYQSICRRLADFGTRASDVTIVLHEPPMQNWGIRGVRADQVELSYRLDI